MVGLNFFLLFKISFCNVGVWLAINFNATSPDNKFIEFLKSNFKLIFFKVVKCRKCL